MKEKLVRYGKFKTAEGYEHCVAAVQYKDVFGYNYDTQRREKIGEEVLAVWRIRGGLNYLRKHELVKCGSYRSLDALMADDKDVYRNLNIEFYEPVEI